MGYIVNRKNKSHFFPYIALSHTHTLHICSRKNFVFLFGALINLAVRVDAYFHPIRMTYPIQPGPFFRAAPNWGKPAKYSLPQKLSNWTDVITVHSPFSSSITIP